MPLRCGENTRVSCLAISNSTLSHPPCSNCRQDDNGSKFANSFFTAVATSNFLCNKVNITNIGF